MEHSEDHLASWVASLDELSYYDLFRLEPTATFDEVRDGFHAFCGTFHPDRHMERPQEDRRALSTIFKRGTEAYVVLTDPLLREEYDAQLAQQSTPNPPRLSVSPHSRPPSRRAPASLEEATRTASARPFARRAEELLKAGDRRQAKLQLVMANHMDPGNPVLEAALAELSARLSSPPK